MSEQIQALEIDLGAVLFDRSRRSMRLTHAGERLLEYAVKLLALSDEARSAVEEAAGCAGTVVIGSLETLAARWLPQLMASLRRDNSNGHVRLHVDGSGALRGAVRGGAIDLCFVFGATPSESGLCGSIVGRTELVAILPAGYGQAPRSIADLADETFLVTGTGCSYRRMFELAFERAGVARPSIAAELDSIASIVSMVEEGAGCALVPRIALRENAALTVAQLDHVEPVSIVMIWRRSPVYSPAMRAFLTAVEGAGWTSGQAVAAIDV